MSIITSKKITEARIHRHSLWPLKAHKPSFYQSFWDKAMTKPFLIVPTSNDKQSAQTATECRDKAQFCLVVLKLFSTAVVSALLEYRRWLISLWTAQLPLLMSLLLMKSKCFMVCALQAICVRSQCSSQSLFPILKTISSITLCKCTQCVKVQVVLRSCSSTLQLCCQIRISNTVLKINLKHEKKTTGQKFLTLLKAVKS